MASASHLLNRFDEKTLGILEILVFLLAFEEMASLFATSSSKLLLNLYQYWSTEKNLPYMVPRTSQSRLPYNLEFLYLRWLGNGVYWHVGFFRCMFEAQLFWTTVLMLRITEPSDLQQPKFHFIQGPGFWFMQSIQKYYLLAFGLQNRKIIAIPGNRFNAFANDLLLRMERFKWLVLLIFPILTLTTF